MTFAVQSTPKQRRSFHLAVPSMLFSESLIHTTCPQVLDSENEQLIVSTLWQHVPCFLLLPSG